MNTTTSPIVIASIDDCWNRIGVVGDQSCEKLEQAVHCRNCEVYAAAAQRNLQRVVGDDYKKDWAAHFRQAAAGTQQLDASCLVFRIGREWLSLPTKMFVSVAQQAKPHRLPHRAEGGLSGIVNVGGTLYPCMSLAALLGIDDNEGEAATGRHTFARLLLTQWEDQAYALPVADLHGILRYATASVQAPAATINKGLSRFLSGVIAHEDMHIGVLDAALIGYQLARVLR
ncbi:chemotaxis protein CheW [Duganella violaceipulchra]|uniref:Chemotaxis protein CheW n=1 Tax=Duganella violaceipulchra TaxID=2849652 RepID=A0AA41HDF8_9BURK|nr:chemotaxis protein CheW [Duganella violaceicalia]MBV6325319.1 chemotaxis protein CheW [Duganella violaceicalia]MCP2009802.1 chemotaxis-related protein WspD [Duganella violaceicalia]